MKRIEARDTTCRTMAVWPLPARNTFNRFQKAKTDDIRITNDVRGGCSLQ